MKVLHVVAGLELRHGGPPRVVASLTHALSDVGVESSVFSPSYPGGRSELLSLPDARVRMFETGRISRWWPGHSPDLRSALVREASDHDVVHIHEMWHHPHFAAARICGSGRVPYIVSPHGSLDPWALALGRLKKRVYTEVFQRKLLSRAAAVHALTETEESQIRDYGFRGAVSVIPNGIDAIEFQGPAQGTPANALYPELAGKKVILFLGRLHEKKGLDLLVSAFSGLRATRPDTHLLIVGPDDGYLQTLEALVRERGVGDAVTLTGPLGGDERLAVMARADVFALPSYSEGFSVSVLEALAAAIPVVISTMCYFPEVEAAGAGLVVEPDVRSVEAALARIIDNPGMADEMGRTGARLVARDYTWDKVAASHISMYENAIASIRG